MTEYGFHPQGLERLAGSLLHFIWQGALVAFVTAVLLKILEKRTAALRYAISLAALGTMLLCASLTFAFYEETGSATLAVLQFLDRSAAQASRSANAQDVAAWTTWIVLAWGAGVAIFAGRLLAGSLLSFRLVRNAQTAIPEEVSRLIERVSKMLPGHRRVQLRISGNIDTPVVFGWLRPVILLPVIVTTGLTEEQLLAILAHEVAHIRRYDFLVNAVQRCVEAVLFYHPAVWWLSSRIRIEREHCCDDLAVRSCGDRLLYAEALIQLERMRGPIPALTIPAAGGPLGARVRRILGFETVSRDWQPALAAMLVVALCVLSGAWPAETIAAPPFGIALLSPPASEMPGTTSAAPAGGLPAIAAIVTAQTPQAPTPPEVPKGPKVGGKVGMLPRGIPAGLIYVELRRSSLSVSGEGQIDLAEAAVADDGSFLFGAVPPGTYTMFVRAKGSIIFSRPPLTTVDVASGNDILNLTLNAEPILYGRVTVDDGSPLPSDAEGATTATVRVAHGLPRLDVEIFPATVQANGSFALRDPLSGLSPSFYIRPADAVGFVSLHNIPNGFAVKSISYQGKDLLQSPIPLNQSSVQQEEIRIVLTKRPSPVFTVSGRVIKPLAAAGPVRLESLNRPDEGGPVTEARPNADGTFTLHAVPPGTYTLRVQGAGPATRVEVTDRDVTGIDLGFTFTQNQFQAQQERAKEETKLFELAPLPQAGGKPMKTFIEDRIGTNSIDCGRFWGRSPDLVAASVLGSLEALLECVRSATEQHKAFIVVTVSQALDPKTRQVREGIDDTNISGIAGDSKGTLYLFHSCSGACGKMAFRECPPNSAILPLDGAIVHLDGQVLTCRQLPPAPAIRWPAPEAHSDR